MKSWILKAGASLAALPLLFVSPILAQETSPDDATPVAATTPAGPALWKVSDEDTTIYLFGTVHILPKEVEWLDDTISDALAQSDMIVTELPMDPGSESELAQLSMKMSKLPEGTTLRSLLTPEQISVLEGALTKMGIPPAAFAQFDSFKPWSAGLTFSVLPLIQQGYSPDSGVEKVLLLKAGDKPRGALETPEFQLSIFDNLPQEAQIAFLMDAASGVDDLKSTLDRMISEWLKGDAETLAELMNEGMDDPVLTEALLYSRNANWAAWVKERLETPGTVFVAVGAGHLAGEKSVQQMLAVEGIPAERIK